MNPADSEADPGSDTGPSLRAPEQPIAHDELPAPEDEPPSLSEEEKKDPISEEVFHRLLNTLSTLAIDGVRGTLHSVRSLRNRELQRCAPKDGWFSKAKELAPEQLQDDAVQSVVDRLGGTLADDFRGLMLSLTGIGLPLAIMQPMWLRLRRSALIAELLGHDAKTCKGDVICAAFAVFATVASAEAAVGLVWKLYCRGSVLRFIPMGSIAVGLADAEHKAAAEVARAFRRNRRPITRTEWDVPLDRVSVGQAIHEAMRKASIGIGHIAAKVATAAAPQLERASASASAAVNRRNGSQTPCTICGNAWPCKLGCKT
jgi:hypothetical protein